MSHVTWRILWRPGKKLTIKFDSPIIKFDFDWKISAQWLKHHKLWAYKRVWKLCGPLWGGSTSRLFSIQRGTAWTEYKDSRRITSPLFHIQNMSLFYWIGTRLLVPSSCVYNVSDNHTENIGARDSQMYFSAIFLPDDLKSFVSFPVHRQSTHVLFHRPFETSPNVLFYFFSFLFSFCKHNGNAIVIFLKTFFLFFIQATVQLRKHVFKCFPF